MFAVLKTGGKQYRVAAGDILKIDKLPGEPGDNVNFKDVLLIGGKDVILGTPTVSGASVSGEIVRQTRDKKVINFVHRRRKASSRRKKGHRQHITFVQVKEIVVPNDSVGESSEG